MTVTSPPYDKLRDYQGYVFDFEAIAGQLWRVTKAGGIVVWVVADATVDGSETGTSFRQALGFMELGFKLHDTMIYENNTPLPQLKHTNRYTQIFAYMFIFSKDFPEICNYLQINSLNQGNNIQIYGTRNHKGNRARPKRFINSKKSKIRGNIWRYNAGFGHDTIDNFAFSHPAIFPEALARDHIISWSNPGDIVLDPMCGSGTTLKMAVEQGRQYIGIDISEEYCELSRQRVNGARVPLPGLEPATIPKPEQLTIKD